MPLFDAARARVPLRVSSCLVMPGCLPAVRYRLTGSRSGVRISTGIWRVVFFWYRA
jgi:hypothetical protein